LEKIEFSLPQVLRFQSTNNAAQVHFLLVASWIGSLSSCRALYLLCIV
jgi:hypothetical protein